MLKVSTHYRSWHPGKHSAFSHGASSTRSYVGAPAAAVERVLVAMYMASGGFDRLRVFIFERVAAARRWGVLRRGL